MFAIAISPAKVIRMAGVLTNIACLFMNKREAASLCGIDNAGITDTIGSLRDKGLASGVITAGREAAIGFDAGGAFSIQPPPARKVADVTGAGDALAGATVAAMMKGHDLRDALREGLAAAMLTVETQASVADFSAREFAAALPLVPEAEAMA